MSKRINLHCPICDFSVDVVIEKTPGFFQIFICPDCKKNVVYYNGKVDIISDKLFLKLVKNDIVQSSDYPIVYRDEKDPAITSETIANLKIALETSKSVDEFLRKV